MQSTGDADGCCSTPQCSLPAGQHKVGTMLGCWGPAVYPEMLLKTKPREKPVCQFSKL